MTTPQDPVPDAAQDVVTATAQAPDAGTGLPTAKKKHPYPIRRLPIFLQVLHWVIIVNFVFNIAYGSYQLFVELTPAGGSVGPLFGAAKDMSADELIIRRLYASEVWISIAGLCVYLALTEYLPRFLQRRGETATGSA